MKLKNKIFGWQGTLIDIISCITLICGTVTCFGLGTMQFSTGLSYVTGIEITDKLCLFVLQQVGTSALQSLAVGAGFLILLITIAACYGSVRIVNGSVDQYLDDTEEGKTAIEISKKEEIEA